MNNKAIFMLDNMSIWKETHDEEIDQICKGMTELERKAYCMGANNLYSLFSAIVTRNFEEGHYTILYPNDNILPSEYNYEDFYKKVCNQNV